MTCPVCMEEFENKERIITTCNHTFCKNCIDKWLSNHSTCPICRHQLRDQPEDEFQRAIRILEAIESARRLWDRIMIEAHRDNDQRIALRERQAENQHIERIRNNN